MFETIVLNIIDKTYLAVKCLCLKECTWNDQDYMKDDFYTLNVSTLLYFINWFGLKKAKLLSHSITSINLIIDRISPWRIYCMSSMSPRGKLTKIVSHQMYKNYLIYYWNMILDKLCRISHEIINNFSGNQYWLINYDLLFNTVRFT